MFDWLFGSKRQTNYDDLNNQANSVNSANTALSDYYNKNIANADWDSLDPSKRNELASEYNRLQGAAEQGSQGYDNYLNAYNQEEKDNKYNYFGNGLLGALLNPIGQTFSAGVDLATGQYGNKDRDVLSDLGALGETALTFIPGVGLAGKAGKIGKAAASVPGMAATGAGFGLADAYRQGGQDTDFGDALGQAASGAAFGAAIPVAGNLLKRRGTNVLTKQMAGRGMDQQAIGQVMNALPNRALYSTAARSFIPKSTFGKVAAGGGLLYGGSQLLGSGGQDQMDPSMMMNDQSGGDITEQQLYNYLMSIGAI